MFGAEEAKREELHPILHSPERERGRGGLLELAYSRISLAVSAVFFFFAAALDDAGKPGYSALSVHVPSS